MLLSSIAFRANILIQFFNNNDIFSSERELSSLCKTGGFRAIETTFYIFESSVLFYLLTNETLEKGRYILCYLQTIFFIKTEGPNRGQSFTIKLLNNKIKTYFYPIVTQKSNF